MILKIPMRIFIGSIMVFTEIGYFVGIIFLFIQMTDLIFKFLSDFEKYRRGNGKFFSSTHLVLLFSKDFERFFDSKEPFSWIASSEVICGVFQH